MDTLTGGVGVCHKGVDIPVTHPVQNIQQGAVEGIPHTKTPGIGGTVDGALHSPVVGLPGVVAVGAGVAQQFTVPIPGQQQRDQRTGAVHPVLILRQGRGRYLKGCRVVQDIPVVDVQDLRRVGPGGQREPGQVLLSPFGAQGFLLRLGQLFQGCFPAQGGRFVCAPFQIREPLCPQRTGALGSLPALMGMQAAGRVICPARVELAACAAHHIDIGPLRLLRFPAHITVSRCFSAPDGRRPAPSPYPLR